MSADIEEQKKLLLPILQRAEEIQAVQPKVAYYCRLYALEQGLKIPRRAKEIDGLVMSTLARLEKDKKNLALDPANDPAACEQFAIDIFNRADRVDRAGRADAATSKAYYAASVFFDICNQFGEVPADIEEKQRYALWRAAEIRKALREGRPPLPPAGTELPAAGAYADSGVTAAADDPTASLPSSNWAPNQDAPQGDPSTGMPDFPSAAFPTPPSLPTPTVHVPPPPPPTARWRPGDHVLYCEDGQPPFMQGTVGMAELQLGGGVIYKVALPTHIVHATEEQLALDASYGTPVFCSGTTHGANDGPATVLAVNSTQWPPRYLLRNEAGATFDATAAQVHTSPPLSAAPSASSSDLGYAAAPMPSFSAPSPAPSAPPPSYHHPPPPAEPTSPFQHTSSSQPPPFSPPSNPSFAGYPSHSSMPAVHAPAAHVAPVSAPSTPSPAYQAAVPAVGTPSLADINEAQKMAKYAASSLAFEDVNSAVKFLSDALRLLTKQ